MLYARFKVAMRGFWQETKGSVTVETVLAIPLLFWSMAATFEFFEVHRYKSAREKATYTIADMISRETAGDGLTSVYIDNAKLLFDEISNDDSENQIRVSIIRYDQTADVYEVSWSEVRGTAGNLTPMSTAQADSQRDRLPLLNHFEEVILVESESTYVPMLQAALADIPIETRSFTSIRFAPQMCFEGLCGPDQVAPPPNT